MKDDWVTIHPETGSVKETARALLSFARTPADVRTESNGDLFRVPPYLADLYTTPPEAPRPPEAPTPPEAPRPRRRTKKEGDE